ncbi:hypothetical protein ASPVEDRAFT_47340 [Aspergillus versicolor CBS 583.65]|uniref:Uncharacterized protein n=1 Tax=Aspergillus versicolor CBS 583.65 TaxID=1036611 RepID=A0A1L9Q323_ASPVE|nr:uncharacterized protein ASPVEDRAFT_47340 [Aspergillus versicolor CBS 583.65]OJJ08136.1 hypothetical protein ASPVEDRAFT_47340 [Aspergillus versicolor CBS 583.65]
MESLPPFLPNAEFKTQHAAAIAKQLRKDQTRCKEGLMPSRLALVLPASPSPLLDAIAAHLTPDVEVSRVLRLARCEAIIGSIKSYWNGLKHTTSEDQDTLLSGEVHVPKTEELEATLKVLQYLQGRGPVSNITPRSSLTEVIAAVRSQLRMSDDMRRDFHNEGRKGVSKQRCYMCRQQHMKGDAHDLYPALCIPCGAFNISSSRLSLPESLVLDGKIALVTGGRINLGYHTALRLLRCGAHVIVSSRYPADAVSRYAREVDFERWQSRLKVVGADFRAAKDAFRLVRVVRRLLYPWHEENPESVERRFLDILINNAAQTLTDPVKAEIKAISREQRLNDRSPVNRLIADTADDGYVPTVRGGLDASWIPKIENGGELLENGTGSNGDKAEERSIAQKGLHTGDETRLGKSSWKQSLDEIPYEDLISAHSVNAFVPLILCRELLPCMGTDDPKSSKRPLGYIVNVSSREGIFDDVANSRSKAGHHVHTNMSKAAINMITETEATTAWNTRRVAMNSVDPGYMSAAPDCQPRDGCPIGFEDGAARVLWPIVVGEREGRVVSGRFLKHFEEGAAIIRRG